MPYKKKSCFLPYSHSRNKIEVELDLSNYETKSNFKKTYQVLIHHNLLKKDDLADLKSETEKLDINK